MQSTDEIDPYEWLLLFEYEDGKLYWRDRHGNVKAGSMVGNKTGRGYWQLCYNGKFYMQHRVIWEMHFGKIQDGYEIDHIDFNCDNNRIENLRLATRLENCRYRRVASNNKLGVKGVSSYGNKFVAYIKIDGKTKNLGYFNTIEEASNCYKKNAKEAFGAFYQGE